MRVSALGAAALLLFAKALLAAPVVTPATEERQESVSPRRLSIGAPGDGFQVVGHGKSGQIRLVTSGLELFTVEPPEKIKPIGKIRSDEEAGREALPVLSPDGDRWLFAGHDGGVLLAEGMQASPLPRPPFRASFLGFSGEDPVVGVRLSRAALLSFPEESWKQEPPQLFRLSGSDWVPFAGNLIVSERSPRQLLVDSSVLVASDSKGRTWVADLYQYRVRRFTSAGRKLLEVRDPALAASAEADSELDQELADRVAKMQANREVKVVSAPKTVVQALGDDRGDALLLVRLADGKAALDRIDGASGDVSRVELRIPDVDRVRSIAAGTEGVVFASFRAADGLYFARWQELESAWSPATGPRAEGGVQAEPAGD